MSRRRGEFEHRTSIFEGAYRAWSHLGGIDPRDIVSKSPSDLDPLTFPHTQDPRLVSNDPSALHTTLSSKDLATAAPVATAATASTSSGTSATVPPVLPHTTAPSSSSAAIKTTQDENAATGAEEQIYPYEPLPRSGLAHPFVQAIISPWLGPDAEHEDTQIGLTTLRTWWQHRRKGESTSAKSALGTEKMKSVVDGYTRHFFNLALVLVMQDGEQPPRTLAKRVKEMEKEGMEFPPPKKESRKGSDRFASGTVGSFSAMAAMSGGTTSQGGGGGGSRGGGGRRLLGIEGAVPEYSCCSSSVFDLGSTHNGAAGAGAVNFRNGGGIGGGGGGGGKRKEWIVEAKSIKSNLFHGLSSCWKFTQWDCTRREDLEKNSCYPLSISSRENGTEKHTSAGVDIYTKVEFEVEISVIDPFISTALNQVLESVALKQMEAFENRCKVIPENHTGI
mmetsp:Transcript_8685/g.16387  ORF Transcript_8685/g.16387 Transcript_8685/m.16387 type:complete len:448 (+) Transcript_8685:196-1539(+)